MQERTCIACRQKRTKRNLLRFVSRDQTLIFDPAAKQQGRGAYICSNKDCFLLALAKNAFKKAFKTDRLMVSSQLIEQVECHIKKNY